MTDGAGNQQVQAQPAELGDVESQRTGDTSHGFGFVSFESAAATAALASIAGSLLAAGVIRTETATVNLAANPQEMALGSYHQAAPKSGSGEHTTQATDDQVREQAARRALQQVAKETAQARVAAAQDPTQSATPHKLATTPPPQQPAGPPKIDVMPGSKDTVWGSFVAAGGNSTVFENAALQAVARGQLTAHYLPDGDYKLTTPGSSVVNQAAVLDRLKQYLPPNYEIGVVTPPPQPVQPAAPNTSPDLSSGNETTPPLATAPSSPAPAPSSPALTPVSATSAPTPAPSSGIKQSQPQLHQSSSASPSPRPSTSASSKPGTPLPAQTGQNQSGVGLVPGIELPTMTPPPSSTSPNTPPSASAPNVSPPPTPSESKPTSPFEMVTQPDTSKSLPSSVVQVGGVAYFSQRDPRWNQDAYHGPGGSGDIGYDGCGATSLAMAITTFTGNVVTPAAAASYIMAHGLVTETGATYDIAMLQVPEAFGLKSYQIPINEASVEQVLKAGGLVIIDGTSTSSMNFPTPATPAGHFYIIRGMNASEGWLIANPDDNPSLTAQSESNIPWNPQHILVPADRAYAVFPEAQAATPAPSSPSISAPAPRSSTPVPIIPGLGLPTPQPSSNQEKNTPPTTAPPSQPGPAPSTGETVPGLSLPSAATAPTPSSSEAPKPSSAYKPGNKHLSYPSNQTKTPSPAPSQTPEAQANPDTPNPQNLAAFMAGEFLQESGDYWKSFPSEELCSGPGGGPGYCTGGFAMSDTMWNGAYGVPHAAYATPEQQYMFAQGQFTALWHKFGGNWIDVAMAWYAGPGFQHENIYAEQAGGYPSIYDYGQSVINHMNKYLNGNWPMPVVPGVPLSVTNPAEAAQSAPAPVLSPEQAPQPSSAPTGPNLPPLPTSNLPSTGQSPNSEQAKGNNSDSGNIPGITIGSLASPAGTNS